MRIPRQIALELSTLCNLKCTLCPTRDESMQRSDTGNMETEFVYSIVDRIIAEHMDTSLTLSVNGESLLHPDIVKILRYITDRNIACYLTTNSSIYHPELFDLMTEKNSFYQLIFSVAGLYDPRSSAIEKGMPGLDRDVSKRNIETFIDLWQRKGKNLELGIKTCRRGQGQEELEHLIEYWLEKGVSFVAIGRPLSDTTGGMPMYPCRYFDDMAMFVRTNGTVLPCTYNVKVANEHAIEIGKLGMTESLIELYNNAEYRELRRKHYAGAFPYPCNTCGVVYNGDGFIGTAQFRNRNMSQRMIYWHDDYSNTFYSYEPKKIGVSHRREWEPDTP